MEVEVLLQLLEKQLRGNCDVYITGEKVLYTIEYAKLAGINLIVGSHTFTEVFGVESLAKKIKDKYKDIEIVRLKGRTSRSSQKFDIDA